MFSPGSCETTPPPSTTASRLCLFSGSGLKGGCSLFPCFLVCWELRVSNFPASGAVELFGCVVVLLRFEGEKDRVREHEVWMVWGTQVVLVDDRVAEA